MSLAISTGVLIPGVVIGNTARISLVARFFSARSRTGRAFHVFFLRRPSSRISDGRSAPALPLG
jgi:hypothetical protein